MLTETMTELIAHGHYGEGSWGGPPPFLFPLVPLLFLLIIAGVILTMGVLRRRAAALRPRREAETRLGERYAAGEIDEEEFRARRKVLREKG